MPQRGRLGGCAQGHRPETCEHDEGRREEAGGRTVGREGHSRGAGTLRHNTGGCDALGHWRTDEGVPLERGDGGCQRARAPQRGLQGYV